MANNYLQFSVGFDLLSEVESKWLKDVGAVMEELPDTEGGDDKVLDDLKSRYGDEIVEVASTVGYDHGDRHSPFDMRVGSDVWIYAEESGDTDAAAELIHRFFKRFRPTDTCVLSWAETCSSMRVDECGGGECLITADWIYWPPRQLHDMAELYIKAKAENRTVTPDELEEELLRKRKLARYMPTVTPDE